MSIHSDRVALDGSKNSFFWTAREVSCIHVLTSVFVGAVYDLRSRSPVPGSYPTVT